MTDTDQHTGWRELDGMTEGFHGLGDIQVHDGFTRTYLFGPVAGNYLFAQELIAPILVEVYEDDPRHGTYSYEEMLELVICTDPDDPGSTEVDSDVHFGPGGYLCRDELDTAIEDARGTLSRSGPWIFDHYDPTEELEAGRLRKVAW